MERFLREWRQDALNKAQYESAIFIGDKLLAMTSKQLYEAPTRYWFQSLTVGLLQMTITTPSS